MTRPQQPAAPVADRQQRAEPKPLRRDRIVRWDFGDRQVAHVIQGARMRNDQLLRWL
jgi:hypothetical protein